MNTKTETSLFIGRFQPFHNGHAGIVKKLLDEKKLVVIGIRNTKRDKDNPYNFEERYWQIRKAFPVETGVDIVRVPNLNELVYGRDVGYFIRKVSLPSELESISGTKIREMSN